MAARRRTSRRARWAAAATCALALTLTACSAPAGDPAVAPDRDWDDVLADADGQTVRLWMYGGDDKGNAYVDDVLAPAAAELGVTLERVPIADTGDAVNRVLSERQADVTDGEWTWSGSTGRTSPPASRPAPGCAAGRPCCPTWRTSTPRTR
ncbi:hypothetical protein [Blastococcus capsensis]|uniref:hypothetical protein n=1 Tax=Blastococcus capsensis TaxID=1564163 RepID=UPI00253F95BB|nr:hypothetical protein [Blastococcus capsensis]MDK3255347.1 hypothetical protein [Blastococcus capsensis]